MAISKEQTENKQKWDSGGHYRCIKSASPGYREGEVYKCYTSKDGYKCLMGRDGHEDLCSMLVSSFRREVQ